ncbi:hypothetical protein J3E69DRAFT_94675 [Trichoderma sp. SZMC 28015]
MPIHVSYLDDRSVLCIANEEKLAKTTCTNETGSQYSNQQKKGGGHSLIISEKKEDHIYGGGMFQIRLRCTWTSVSFFLFLFFSFFPGLAFGPAYHGAFEPSWSVRRWWPPHSDGYTGGTF